MIEVKVDLMTRDERPVRSFTHRFETVQDMENWFQADHPNPFIKKEGPENENKRFSDSYMVFEGDEELDSFDDEEKWVSYIAVAQIPLHAY